MKLKDIKLFDKQPKINQSHIDELTINGFIVPSKTPRDRGTQGVKDEITNPTVGDVVSYGPLDALLKKRLLNQDDARRLLVVETLRENGRPRQSHIARLMVVAFASDKNAVLDKIDKLSKLAWIRKAK